MLSLTDLEIRIVKSVTMISMACLSLKILLYEVLELLLMLRKFNETMRASNGSKPPVSAAERKLEQGTRDTQLVASDELTAVAINKEKP